MIAVSTPWLLCVILVRGLNAISKSARTRKLYSATLITVENERGLSDVKM